jgi:hypothetical protein
MTFATEAAKSASERFFLVRLTPRKYLGAGTSIGGSQYTFAVSSTVNVSIVTVNNATEAVWTHVGDLLTVTSATDLSNVANIVTLDHNIFVTGTSERETAAISGIPDALWSPLLLSYPGFSQSMSNIAEGIFSLSGTSIELISVDRWGQKLFGDNDSFSKASVTVWACIDTVSTNRMIFDGEVSSASYRYGKLTLQVIDTFSKLKDTASFGTKSQSHVYVGNSYTPYSDPRDENRAMPLTFGRSSPMTISFGWRHLDAYGSPNGSLYHLSSGNKAIKVGPSQPTGATTIKFLCGRVIGSDVKRLNFGTISAAYALYVQRQVQEVPGTPPYPLNIYDKILYLTVSTFNGEIGDYIPTVNGWVCGYQSGLWGSYNLAIACPEYGISELDSGNIGNPSGGVAVPSIPNNTIPSVSCWIDGSNNVQYKSYYYTLSLLPSAVSRTADTRYLKFTVSTETYSFNGQNITLVFAEISPTTNGLNILDQSNSLVSATIRCRISPTNPMTHADCLKYVVSGSGMSTNAASFTQADSDLAANVSMTLPLSERNEFESYLSAAEIITKSTLGLLRVNTSREVEYEIIKNPTALSIDATRNTINMLSDATSCNLEYQDIYSAVSFQNEQLNDLTAIAGTGPKAFVESAKTKQLHRIDRIKTINHCLDSIQNRKNAIAGYFSAPTVEYKLNTSSEDLASAIGDVVEITNEVVGNDTGITKAIIVSLDQYGSETTIKLNEIKGVP